MGQRSACRRRAARRFARARHHRCVLLLPRGRPMVSSSIEPRTKESPVSKPDDQIEADVRAALANDPHIPYADEIAIESYDGFVTLRGTVGSFGQERAAVADTRRARH